MIYNYMQECTEWVSIMQEICTNMHIMQVRFTQYVHNEPECAKNVWTNNMHIHGRKPYAQICTNMHFQNMYKYEFSKNMHKCALYAHICLSIQKERYNILCKLKYAKISLNMEQCALPNMQEICTNMQVRHMQYMWTIYSNMLKNI